jgi:hypothetical protein
VAFFLAGKAELSDRDPDDHRIENDQTQLDHGSSSDALSGRKERARPQDVRRHHDPDSRCCIVRHRQQDTREPNRQNRYE